jgi:hypothetical protein
MAMLKEIRWNNGWNVCAAPPIKPWTLEQEVIMEFTGNLLAPTYHNVKAIKHIKQINPISMMRDTCVLLNDRKPQTLAKLSGITGFDIEKSDSQITHGEGQISTEKITKNVCRLLYSILEKPKTSRSISEQDLAENFHKLKTPEGNRYTVEGFGQLISDLSIAGLAKMREVKSQENKPEKMERDRRILLLVNSGRYFIHEIAAIYNLHPNEVLRICGRQILKEKNESFKKQEHIDISPKKAKKTKKLPINGRCELFRHIKLTRQERTEKRILILMAEKVPYNKILMKLNCKLPDIQYVKKKYFDPDPVLDPTTS